MFLLLPPQRLTYGIVFESSVSPNVVEFINSLLLSGQTLCELALVSEVSDSGADLVNFQEFDILFLIDGSGNVLGTIRGNFQV